MSTKSQRTPTPIRHWQSAHPAHLKRSIPFSQALRLRRIVSNDATLRTRIEEYKDYFIASGYKKNLLDQAMDKVLVLSQKRQTELPLLLHITPV